MKKNILTLVAIVGLSAGMLVSCGEKYTPMTSEQITAQADSIFNASAEAKKAELQAACEADMANQVTSKVAELQAAAQQATAAQ